MTQYSPCPSIEHVFFYNIGLQDLHESAAKVVARGQDLVRARRVEKNIATTIESLSMCLPVLQTLSKLSKQMKEKRFHPALKTLEQLEHTYLPRIANYR
jgi:hypothetical protein